MPATTAAPAAAALFMRAAAARPAVLSTTGMGMRMAVTTQRTGLRFSQRAGRRWQSSSSSSSGSAGDGGAHQQQQQSWFKRMWDSPVGFKTVHFWAPVMKWCLVIAGIGDFARPAEKLSATQNGALTATGLIWTRWCFVIRPRNVLLAAVNFFLACVGVTQLTRIALYHRGLKDGSVEAGVQKLEGKAAEVEGRVAEGVEKVKEAVKSS